MAQEKYRRPAEERDDDYIIDAVSLTQEFDKSNKPSLDVKGKIIVDCPVATTLNEGVSIKATDAKKPQKMKEEKISR